MEVANFCAAMDTLIDQDGGYTTTTHATFHASAMYSKNAFDKNLRIRQVFLARRMIFLVQVGLRLRTEVLHTPSSTQLGFKLLTSTS